MLCKRDVGFVLLAVLDEVSPHFRQLEGFGVSNNYKEVSRPRYGDIKSSHISQKTEAALNVGWKVAPYTIKDNYVFLSALECIYSINFYGLL